VSDALEERRDRNRIIAFFFFLSLFISFFFFLSLLNPSSGAAFFSLLPIFAIRVLIRLTL
jgi:hypothetical protein